MNIEKPEGPLAAGDPSKPDEGLAIIATPLEGEQPVVRRTPEGGFTIFLRGEIRIAYRPPASEAPESPVTDAKARESSFDTRKRFFSCQSATQRS